ncbi:non-hydrolyzing UDP-N-acetylglucosamine 2-epimerase [Actinophytocola oryzae]|uniref:UDP-N-acetylglucosamine 2-epimerase (non-hydrolyzing) n=1 Tax=Actinophytocola oryzae TaxID=502181 RepID=A0A4R7VR99_9PSEU|nr:UDP-N-acetylglucosamine 2-epimerase (non-hydrolyzing) [Actinophytocola oryzae]TDV52234.1 UDP-N-acetylglucosamine 2-epimerase [Actinophytocola oryzae]
MDEVLLLVGTRPEAVKAAPVALCLAEHPHLTPAIVHSGQHVAVVEQALASFGLRPDEALCYRRETGGQAELFAHLLPALDEVLARRRPRAVLVQGDTATALAGALAAFWRRIPVVHLEAGLRTGDLTAPFPEEANRQLVARVAALHLAPTADAAAALSGEHLCGGPVVVTGNTVVDAALRIAALETPAASPDLVAVEHDLETHGGRLVLVTAHRRESWGAPLNEVLGAVATLAESHPDIRVLLPTHPNPSVRAQVAAVLGDNPRVTLTDPLSYPDLVRVLRRAALVLTDSGGIQEEAPSFGVPVLVLREVTERMEAVHAGCAWLVGTDRARILLAADEMLRTRLRIPVNSNPFGDGNAANRVCAAIAELLAGTTTPVVLEPAS